MGGRVQIEGLTTAEVKTIAAFKTLMQVERATFAREEKIQEFQRYKKRMELYKVKSAASDVSTLVERYEPLFKWPACETSAAALYLQVQHTQKALEEQNRRVEDLEDIVRELAMHNTVGM